jgi:RNA polymerase sigma-70 factor (ECF subfamily)
VRHAFLEFVRKQERRREVWSVADPETHDQIRQVIDRWGNDVREIYEHELELGQQAYRAVRGSLGDDSIRAFRMMKIEGRPGREVAEALGMTVAAVYKSRERAARALREELVRLRELGPGN